MPVLNKELLCTLGPASMNRQVIQRLSQLGVSLFRINLSHTKIDDLVNVIEAIRCHTDVPVCLDSEGAQIRTGSLKNGTITLKENSSIQAQSRNDEGDINCLSFYPANITDEFQVGDFISIDFNAVLVQVTALDQGIVTLRVLNAGQVGQNKAVTVERDISMPALTEKDRRAFDIGLELGIKHFALSFANRASDLEDIRAIVGEDAFVISKIECLNGLDNLEAIANRSNALLIDRGDLSRQVPIEQIPRVQKAIIQKTREMNRKVYVATNLLESMVSNPQPTRAEVNDIHTTLSDGADGLVLAAETAIGDYPIQCANMIVKMIREQDTSDNLGHNPEDSFSLLVPPHGGPLIHRIADKNQRLEAQTMPKVCVENTDLLDCQQIALGTYSPLTGFMDKQTLFSVLNKSRLPGGTIWTLPLLLGLPGKATGGLSSGDKIILTAADGKPHSILEISQVFQLDKETVAQRWFGTSSKKHPGVQRFLDGPDVFVGGEITLIDPLSSDFTAVELSPHQTRYIFAHKGWTQVVGFHTRNACHRAHEYIQLKALQDTGADGLYISPVTGPKKTHDFMAEPIIDSYQALIDDQVFPEGKIILGGFSTYSRYSGPREAVFTALCRKNMGCSHFIIGRDHTGVGDFYQPGANQRLFDELGDMGITPVFFPTVGYNPDTKAYEADNGNNNLTSISGTEVRQTLMQGERLPDWFMRDAVQDVLLARIQSGSAVFY